MNNKFCKTLQKIQPSNKISRWIGNNFWDKTDFKLGFIHKPSVREDVKLFNEKFVLDTLKDIENVCGITFTIVKDYTNGDIRISFDESDGAWSYVGTECKTIPVTQATTNLGWLDKSTVLHEVLHFLGLHHEHQNPKKPIPWNKANVYRDLSGGPNFWSKETINANMFDAPEIQDGSDFDDKSVMLYPIPSHWVLTGKGFAGNETLSAKDIEFLQKYYPKKTISINPTSITEFSKQFCNTIPFNELYKLNRDTLLRILKRLDSGNYDHVDKKNLLLKLKEQYGKNLKTLNPINPINPNLMINKLDESVDLPEDVEIGEGLEPVVTSDGSFLTKLKEVLGSSNFKVSIISIILLFIQSNGIQFDMTADSVFEILKNLDVKNLSEVVGVIVVNFLSVIIKLSQKIVNKEISLDFLKSDNFKTQALTVIALILGGVFGEMGIALVTVFGVQLVNFIVHLLKPAKGV